MKLLGARRCRCAARQQALDAKPASISGDEAGEAHALQQLVTELLGEVDYLRTELELTRGAVLVAREGRRGRLHRSLPGGRVKPREDLVAALRREVREETGLEVEPGRLLCVAEVNGGSRVKAMVLVFEARTEGSPDEERTEWLDPALVHDPPIFPPVLAELAAGGPAGGGRGTHWLGNIFDPGLRG